MHVMQASPYCTFAAAARGVVRALQVDRTALPMPDWSMKVPRSYLAPRNRLEMEVQLIWQAVLNKSDMISIDADFSELGGNMMHAVIANGIVRCALHAGHMLPATCPLFCVADTGANHLTAFAACLQPCMSMFCTCLSCKRNAQVCVVA